MEVESEIALLKEAARKERNEAADRLDDARDELGEFQHFVQLRGPDSRAAWQALKEAKQQRRGKQQKQKHWFEEAE